MTAIKKGETVFRLHERTTLIVHLDSEGQNVWPHDSSDLRDLPGFADDDDLVSIDDPELEISEPVLKAIEKLQKNSRSDKPTVVRAVILLGIKLLHETLLKSKWIQRAQEQFGGELDSDAVDQVSAWEEQKETAVAREALKNVCSPQNWYILLACIAQHVVLVHVENPLLQYAKQQVPLLTEEERATVAKRLELDTTASTVGLSKRIQEGASPQLYAILLDPEDSSRLPHSCLANVSLLPDRESWKVSALYDVQDSKEAAICRIEDSDVEGREQQVLLLTGSSCGCIRCRYEVDKNTSQLSESLSDGDLLQLGRFFLSNGRLDKAEELFKTVRSKSSNISILLDASHALGAIELSRNKFLKAQQIWKEARECLKKSDRHDGLILQWHKIDAYGYFSPDVKPETTPKTSDETERDSEQLYPHVFRCNMLNNDTCHQIISWAEDAKWTKQRHYAVPTLDIPVHTSPVILDWFNHWFKERVCPVLARQFRTSPKYFVHDAFVVKYEASLISNHLPIHTDESTHSFVLALNDDYEGGGTYLADHDSVARLQTGQMLSFRGDLVAHGGEAVTVGRRYILAVFLYHDDSIDDVESTKVKTGTETLSSNTVSDAGGNPLRKKRPFHQLLESTRSSDFTFGFQME